MVADTFRTFALELARASGDHIRPLFARPDLTVEFKSDHTIVTAADRGAEQLMREMIRRRFPGHGILGEEFGEERPDAEFVWVLEGEVVLVTDQGEQILGAGECAGFPAGEQNGHHIQNRSTQEAVPLEVGSRRPGEDVCTYPDIDMALKPEVGFIHRDGRPYEADGKK